MKIEILLSILCYYFLFLGIIQKVKYYSVFCVLKKVKKNSEYNIKSETL